MNTNRDRYTIISAASLDSLVAAVNRMSPDWKPSGGPFVIPKGDRVEVEDRNGDKFRPIFAQALVR